MQPEVITFVKHVELPFHTRMKQLYLAIAMNTVTTMELAFF
jgi:hypothetical protein